MIFSKNLSDKGEKNSSPEQSQDLESAEKRVAMFADDDPEMQAAIDEARRTFCQFLEIMKDVPEMLDGSLLKYGFAAETMSVEHMFVNDLEWDGQHLVGILNSEPQYTSQWSCGDRVVVKPELVTDWAYYIDGAGHGGFTFKYMWSQLSQADRDMYNQYPPYVWFNLT